MSRRKRLPPEPVTVTIESLSHEGRGIGHVNGKTVFVEGALPGEEVRCRYTRQKAKFAEAVLVEIVHPSPERIEAKCEFYHICGGCSFQHTRPAFQLEHKQSALLDQLQRIGGLQPEEILPPLTGPAWGYRRRARLGVKYVEKKQRMLVGFREKNSPLIADISHCEILHPAVGHILQDLQTMISQLGIYRQLPQIEVAVADNVTALVLRHLSDFSDNDIELLRRFEREKNISFYLQPAGLDSVHPLTPERAGNLYYRLPEQGIDLFFQPTDFIQVNADINQQMIDLALQLLQPGPDDNVLDLFCGLGNFSLPLAKHSCHVLAVEGDSMLIERAKFNADYNQVENIDFHIMDLSEDITHTSLMQNTYRKILLDPPRSGANSILRQLPLETAEKLLYVSCNPATLARDAGILVNECGFRLQQAGVMDMFPHTNHVESIALFTR